MLEDLDSCDAIFDVDGGFKPSTCRTAGPWKMVRPLDFLTSTFGLLLVPFPVPFGFGQGEGVGRDAETLGQHHAAMGRVVREKFHHQSSLIFFMGWGI